MTDRIRSSPPADNQAQTKVQPRVCDVCTTTLPSKQGNLVSAEEFRHWLTNGYRPDEETIGVLEIPGTSTDHALHLWRAQCAMYSSDWLLCDGCFRRKPEPESAYVCVTEIAAQAGGLFSLLDASVFLSRSFHDLCVLWSDDDNELQTFQEEDARLWDVLFTAACLETQVNVLLRAKCLEYSICCVPRDGESVDAVRLKLGLYVRSINDSPSIAIDFAGGTFKNSVIEESDW
jgi:hypothetical protein